MDTRVRELLRAFAVSQDPRDAVAACSMLLRTQDESGFGSPVRIPALGTRITLTSPWIFTLCAERRNTKFHDVLFPESEFKQEDGYLYEIYKDRFGEPVKTWRRRQTHTDKEAMLPAGTVLRVDRIYIRRGQEGYDSVSFVCESIPHVESDASAVRMHKKGSKPPKVVGRFWARLRDVNEIVGTWDVTTLPTTEGTA